MAIAAIAAAAAVASAAAGTYGAVTAGQNARNANQINAGNLAQNRSTSIQNSLLDAVNNDQNQTQRNIDNRNYDAAVGREEKQRQLINALATATQYDTEGNAVRFDPVSRSWVPVAYGPMAQTNIDRRHQQESANYTQALLASTLGNLRRQGQLRDAGVAQTAQRALGQELLQRYAANQGRTPQQMEAAGIERNVAQATDPLRTGGNMAMLAGYRQGNSANDALLGALARQSQGGTRSAIAQARYDAPTASNSERDAAAKAMLSPATTLLERGSAGPDGSAPTYSGDNSGALISAINRTNPAAIGSNVNPRSGAMMGVQRGNTNLQGYTPINASGGEVAGIAASLKGLLQSDDFRKVAQKGIDWWNSKPTDPSGIQYSQQSDYQQTDRNW